MACFHPLQAYQMVGKKTANGKDLYVFSEQETKGTSYVKVPLPCGQCIGCRIDRSKDQAIRCVHEASLWSDNCYITLTYNEETLKGERSLNRRDWQLFVKKLRKHYSGCDTDQDGNRPIRYFQAGEYGEVCEVCGRTREKHGRDHRYVPMLGRPHFHACLFNFDFRDKYYWCTRRGNRLYRSETLERLWSTEISKGKSYDKKPENLYSRRGKLYHKNGFCTIGDVNFRSAAYIARYVTKKITGRRASDHYRIIDRETGEISTAMPEYVAMSNRPAIGKTWYNTVGSADCYPKDFLTVNGRKYRVPKYYDKLLEADNPRLARRIKQKRRLTALENADNNTMARLKARKKVFISKVGNLERRYDDGSESL